MKLPITFPSDVEVIAEEAARFRVLSPQDACGRYAGCSRPGADDATVAPGGVPARIYAGTGKPGATGRSGVYRTPCPLNNRPNAGRRDLKPAAATSSPTTRHLL